MRCAFDLCVWVWVFVAWESCVGKEEVSLFVHCKLGSVLGASIVSVVRGFVQVLAGVG